MGYLKYRTKKLCAKEKTKEGVFAHGLLPFVLFRYRQVAREPFGTGLVHDYAGTQHAIDRYIKYIDDNARQSSVQRHFIRKGRGINPDEVADYTRDVIEWEGADIREVMQTVQAAPLNGQVYQMMNYLVDTMKQDCGQNQFSRGEGGLGVTAASAIQALQDAGGKITRWHTGIFKEAFKELVEQLLWVLSEYIDAERVIRIVGGWDGTGNMRDRLVTLRPTGRDPDISLKAARRIVEAEERQDRSAARQEELRADLQSLREDGFTDEELRALVTDSGVREDWQGGMSLRRAAMSYMRRQADSARAQRQEKAPGRAAKRGVETVKTASAAAVRRNQIADMTPEEFRAFDRRLMDAAMNGQRVRL